MVSLILKRFKISVLDIDEFLKFLDLSSYKTTNFWINQYADANFEGLDYDGRTNRKTDLFYDIHPELEKRKWLKHMK